jgi:GNAT superfamily N-acetyltransferase
VTSDAELRRLVELDYWTWIEAFADTDGVEVVVAPDVRYRVGEVDHEYLNHAYAAQLDPDTADVRIRDVVAAVGRGTRPFFWTIWPSDGPPDLAARLVAAGFELDGDAPLMAVELANAADPGPTPPELVIRRVDDPTDLAEVSAVVAASLEGDPETVRPFAATFERLILEPEPRVTQFAGWADGRLVTAGALFTGSGVAGIYGIMTTEEARGRGYGRAITAAAMDEGRRRGLHVSVLLASDLGQPVYRRLGFREVGRVTFMRWPGGPPR